MNSQDLAGEIEQHRKQLARHPDHTTYLKNLADALEKRSLQSDTSHDINEVVQLHRQILALHPPDHQDHALQGSRGHRRSYWANQKGTCPSYPTTS
ncbi:hypothetical protein DFH06DRAFT_609232 [Mycena polygramma]|nr:hypothetical protein DFH06DRAFT_609232 [Mycena polygramma]